MTLSRRNFFKLAASGAVAPFVPEVAAKEVIITRRVKNFKKYSGKDTFSEIITTTLKNNRHLVADNISQNNALLVKMKGRKNGNRSI